MDTLDKLRLLSDASRYDLACACGTKDGEHRKRGEDGTWLYPVSLANGGKQIMLKTLMSNVCSSDCAYCPYRSTMDVRRCSLLPDEVASIFMDYVRQRKVIGLFLSSGVVGTPDRTMEMLTSTAAILRKKHAYRGHIHLKVIPGSSQAAIDTALSLANAVSVNIETPGEKHCAKLSGKKRFIEDIIGSMQYIARQTGKGMKHSRVRQSTQFIVGASDETDAEIVTYTSALYRKLELNRVYFSAYQRGLGRNDIPGEQMASGTKEEGFLREHRLYQVDFLLRKYGFQKDEIPFDAEGRLIRDRDPKRVWADSHPDRFPIDVNTATAFELLRVPGIGPETANRIVNQRKTGRINSVDHLPFKGKRLADARPFLKV